MTHICVSNLGHHRFRQWLVWTNGGILLIGSSGTSSSEIWIKIHQFSYKKMHGVYFLSAPMCGHMISWLVQLWHVIPDPWIIHLHVVNVTLTQSVTKGAFTAIADRKCHSSWCMIIAGNACEVMVLKCFLHYWPFVRKITSLISAVMTCHPRYVDHLFTRYECHSDTECHWGAFTAIADRKCHSPWCIVIAGERMMTFWPGNAFRIKGPFWGNRQLPVDYPYKRSVNGILIIILLLAWTNY